MQDADANSYDTVLIGTQCWMASNLNVGTRINGSGNQTNNATIEKYCYGNNESNCDTYGGLYQWDEAMGYVTTEGAQGICPAGWHIPTDAEQHTLDAYLATGACNASRSGNWDCDPAGAALKSGGSSGFNALMAGFRSPDGSFRDLSSFTHFWSGTENGSNAFRRQLSSGSSTVNRYSLNKLNGYSIRCLRDTPNGGDGIHTLTAVARDAAGNTTTSSGITVTVDNTATDTQAPTTPTNLTATEQSFSRIELTWTASTDNVGVTGYKIYRDGSYLTSVNTTSYSDTGLAANTAYNYTVSAYDAAGNESLQSASAIATTQSSGGATLPELPREYIDTTYSTPTGATCTAMNSSEFQTCLNNATLNSTIVLQAGTTYTGPFTLPNKTSGSGWIYIVSSNLTNLPNEGNRVSPLDATDMPILQPNVSGSGRAVITATSAHHYRFVGIRFRPIPGNANSALVTIGNGETTVGAVANNIVFDRCYLHGDPTVGSRRAIIMDGAYLSVIDSYLSDFKEVGADTQTLWTSNAPGPFKIVNNYLEAAGENIMFGGGSTYSDSFIPADIEIRKNHFYKPLSWKNENWTVKNLFELKIGRRILLEGNILENMWDAAQSYAINLKSVDQSGSAPFSVTEDVTLRNNKIMNVGHGITISGQQNAGRTARINIENNLIKLNTVSSSGRIFLITSSPYDITINHTTAAADGLNALLWLSVQSGQRLDFTNNIFSKGTYGIKADGTAEGTASLNAAFSNYLFSKNALIGANSSIYPTNNFFPSNITAVGFVDYASGNYRLSSLSPYKNAGTDGKDLGADIDALDAATACAIDGQCKE